MDKLGLEFKQIIAYLIPGIVSLYAISFFIPPIEKLLFGQSGVPEDNSFLPIVLLSIGAGMAVNALTWATLRHVIEIKHPRPSLIYASLTDDKKNSFEIIIDQNYRYYQSYSNLFTSGMLLMVAYFVEEDFTVDGLLVAGILILIVLYFASQDALRRAYSELDRLIGNNSQSK